MTNFGYQLQLRGPDVEKEIQGEEKLRQFLNVMYGGRTPEGRFGFTPEAGILFDVLPNVRPSPLLSEKDMDFYVQEFVRNGMRGPLNWYRTRKINFEEEQPLARRAAEEGGHKFQMPTMFITALQDRVLLPSMSAGMEKHFAGELTRREVDSAHWAMLARPREINAHIEEWIEGVVMKGVEPKPSL
jgi:soluble epoxide hydrolase / lipid-phosphate phosphatase